MNKLLKMPVALMIGLTLFTSCRKDDPEPENEEELITTVQLTFTPSAAGATPVVARWRDLDGDGGNPPVVDAVTLQRGTTYNMAIRLLDETKTPAKNITEEIEEEDEAHQFFFTATGLAGMTIAYVDRDSNIRPIGLSNTVTTPDNAATGTLTVILRHDLNKAAAGVANGDITNAGGETDVQAPFSVTIQ